MSLLQETYFRPAPYQPQLNRREVHLWRIDLAEESSSFERWMEVLTPSEISRAERFRFERDRVHFATGRAILRMVLGKYTGIEPDALPLSSGAFGKPHLLGELGEWRFNLSHSGDLMLLGVAWQRDIGVDVESIREGVPAAQMAEQTLSPEEAATVLSAPPELRALRFAEAWTRTEARLKAVGTGLSGLDLDRGLDEVPWRVHTFCPAEGFVASVAAEGEDDFYPEHWQW